MRFITNLLWVFVLFAFLGWAVSFVFRCVKKRKLVNPGFITSPFFPSSGLMVMIVYLLSLVTHNSYMIMFASAIILTVGKYLYELAFERTFGFKWKDLSKRRFNLNGYVLAYEPLFYGVGSALLCRYAFAPIMSLIGAMHPLVALLIPAIIAGIIVADLIVSVMTVIHLRRNLRQMKNISELLDDNTSDKTDEQLRAEYEKKCVKSKRFRGRLVRAFPDMQSVNYEQQLADLKLRFDVIREKNDETYEHTIVNREEQPFAYGLSFTKLFWLFFVGSFFGTFLETIWAFLTLGVFEMRVGMVWGPFIPVYGGGAVAITLCLYRLHKARDLVIYLASAVIGATFEYFCSYFLEKSFGIISWDYSNTPFNIDGRTNLMFALIWGLLGLSWLRYIYPTFSNLVEKIPKKVGRPLTIVLVIFMAVNGAFSCAAVYRMGQRAQNKPAANVAEEWIDNTFNDEYMHFIFPHMATPEAWEKALAEEAKAPKK